MEKKEGQVFKSSIFFLFYSRVPAVAFSREPKDRRSRERVASRSEAQPSPDNIPLNLDVPE
jgi:hypothetical protein